MNEARFAKRVVKDRDAAILDACVSCFSERGCFHTHVDHVIADVGLGKGTLYRHYPSRDDLFGAASQKYRGALLAHCEAVWDTHQADPKAALCAVIGELVRLNREGDSMSPLTVARLGCSRHWMNPSHSDETHETLDVAFIPFVRRCQHAGLFAQTSDPAWIAATILALVGVPAVTSPESGSVKVTKREASRASRRTRKADDDSPNLAHRITHLLQRAFGPGS